MLRLLRADHSKVRLTVFTIGSVGNDVIAASIIRVVVIIGRMVEGSWCVMELGKAIRYGR